jgi:hypothetical protein
MKGKKMYYQINPSARQMCFKFDHRMELLFFGLLLWVLFVEERSYIHRPFKKYPGAPA